MLICVCITQELVLQETAKIQREVVGRVKGQSASAGTVYLQANLLWYQNRLLAAKPLFQGTPKNLVIHVMTVCALVFTCKYWCLVVFIHITQGSNTLYNPDFWSKQARQMAAWSRPLLWTCDVVEKNQVPRTWRWVTTICVNYDAGYFGVLKEMTSSKLFANFGGFVK